MKKIFWANRDRVDTLRRLLNQVLGRGKPLTVERMLSALHHEGVSPSELPKPRALRDFLAKGRRPRDDRQLEHLFRWVMSAINIYHLQSPELEAAYEQATLLYDEFRTSELIQSAQPVGEPKNATSHLASALQMFLHLGSIDFLRLNERIFQQAHAILNRRNYYCYREHSTAGFLVKSHLRLEKQNNTPDSMCTFVTRVRDEGGTIRESGGLVLPLRRTVYLVGQVDHGAAMETLAIPNLESSKSFYIGMIMSVDEDLNPIATPCVLVPTPFDFDDDRATTGIQHEAEVEHDFVRAHLRRRDEKRIQERLDSASLNVSFSRNALSQFRVIESDFERLVPSLRHAHKLRDR